MKWFKNVVIILLTMGIFFIHLQDGTVLQAKNVVTRWKYVIGYTIDTPDEDLGTYKAKEIIIPREQVLYIEER